MLEEHKDLVAKMKQENPHFAAIVEKHDLLDEQINELEEGRGHAEHFDLEKMKKEKLALKDEANQFIIQYKKEHNL